jgi:hypothetical protein
MISPIVSNASLLLSLNTKSTDAGADCSRGAEEALAVQPSRNVYTVFVGGTLYTMLAMRGLIYAPSTDNYVPLLQTPLSS